MRTFVLLRVFSGLSKIFIHETHETNQKEKNAVKPSFCFSHFVRFVDKNMFANLNVNRT